MKTSEAIVSALKSEGVEMVFTVPGEHTLPLLRAARKELRVVNAKLELSAAFTALGYARVKRDVGVLFTLSGPGLIASLSPITEALIEGDAMIIIATIPTFKEGSGEYMHKLLNKGDQTAAARPLTKAQFLIDDPKGVYDIMAEAFSLARSGKPGPVYIEIPTTMLDAEAPVPDHYLRRPVSKEEPSDKVIDEVYQAIVSSRRPSIIAGRGVYLSGAEGELMELAEILRAPVMTTIMGKGLVPPDHSLFGGVAAGSAGNQVSRAILSKSDVVLSIGNRFSEMGTGRFTLEVPGKLIHVNISGHDMATRYKPFLGVQADAKKFLTKLISKLKSKAPMHSDWDLDWLKKEWEDESKKKRTKYEEAERAEVIEPWLLVREIERTISKDGIITGDVGAHRIESFLIRTGQPGSYVTTTSYVSMGLAIPSAVAACLVYPQKDVVAIVGDGAFLMTGLEILTALQYGLSPKIVVFNDSSYKILKVYESRNYGSMSPEISNLPKVDFARMAEGMGAKAIKVSRIEDLHKAIAEALAEKKRPVVVDVSVDPESVPLPFQDLYGAARIGDITKRPS
jgi:acetolactate synthase-1/2/3 large subunit